MPMRPPRYRAPGQPTTTERKAWASTTTSSTQRYGRHWRALSEQVRREEPLCRVCLREGRTALSTNADHIKPKGEGGTDERHNLQGLCTPCHNRKTAQEAQRGSKRST